MTAPTARATPTVSTRILIISDTHAADLLPSSSSGYAFREPLPPADVLLHCGDLTFQGGMDEYEGALRLLSAADAGLKLVIAGNHDTTLDGGCAARSSTLLGRRWGGARPDSGSAAAAAAAARRLWTCDDTREKGIVYLDEGVHRFTLGNGALLTVSRALIPHNDVALRSRPV